MTLKKPWALSLYSFFYGAIGPEFHVPLWIVLSCHAAMGLGTLFGGWRIVETMGMKITKLRPIGGMCAETAGAITLLGRKLGHSRLHHSHYYWLHYGRRFSDKILGRSLGVAEKLSGRGYSQSLLRLRLAITWWIGNLIING